MNYPVRTTLNDLDLITYELDLEELRVAFEENDIECIGLEATLRVLAQSDIYHTTPEGDALEQLASYQKQLPSISEQQWHRAYIGFLSEEVDVYMGDIEQTTEMLDLLVEQEVSDDLIKRITACLIPDREEQCAQRSNPNHAQLEVNLREHIRILETTVQAWNNQLHTYTLSPKDGIALSPYFGGNATN